MSYKYNKDKHSVDEQPTMGEPDKRDKKYITDKNRFNYGHYGKDIEIYKEEIASLRSILIPKDIKVDWKDGQELVEGKDFGVNYYPHIAPKSYKAIPIKQE